MPACWFRSCPRLAVDDADVVEVRAKLANGDSSGAQAVDCDGLLGRYPLETALKCADVRPGSYAQLAREIRLRQPR